MIEKIIENWLIRASERSYQLPFCYLLMQEGKTILHLTRHSAMEQGKDIIAVDMDGQVHAYQLKGIAGGRLTISGWQEIQHQLIQMVLTPCAHPSMQITGYHKSYLVINGDIDEEVQHAITMFNMDWEKKGFPQYRLETIVKGQILEMAFNAKELFIPSEVTDFKALLEFNLETGIGFLDKGKLSKMLISLMEEKSEGNETKFKRVAGSSALLCSLATASFTKNQNHVAIIEAWVVYILSMSYIVQKNNWKISNYKNEIGMAEEIITATLKTLFNEIKDKKDFFNRGNLNDAFVFRARTTILIGYISFLGIICDEPSYEDFDKFIEAHIEETGMWGESCIPFFLSAFLFYLKHNKKEKADRLLRETFQRTINSIITPDILFPDIYTSAEDAISLSFAASSDDPDLPTPRVSYVIEPLLSLLVKMASKDFINEHWPEISRCIFCELKIENSYDFYRWRTASAQLINKHPKAAQSWQELLKEGSFYDDNSFTKTLLTQRKWVPLFLMVYPHRLNNNIVKWLSTGMTSAV